MRLALACLVLVLVLAVGGITVIAEAPFKPPVQKVEHVVPDDQLPR